MQKSWGLHLSGPKSNHTTLTEFEIHHSKIFLKRIETNLSDSDIRKIPKEEILVTQAPLSAPPCIPCTLDCPGQSKCVVKETQKLPVGYFPYIHRYSDVYLKEFIQPKIQFVDLDPSFGSNRSPLYARMKHHQSTFSNLFESQPKWNIAIAIQNFKFQHSLFDEIRSLEQGKNAREKMILAMIKAYDLFIYDEDLEELILELPKFDSFFLGFLGIQKILNKTLERPVSFIGNWPLLLKID